MNCHTSSGTGAGILYSPLSASYIFRTVFTRDDRRAGEKTTGGLSEVMGSGSRCGDGSGSPKDNLVWVTGRDAFSLSLVVVGVDGNNEEGLNVIVVDLSCDGKDATAGGV